MAVFVLDPDHASPVKVTEIRRGIVAGVGCELVTIVPAGEGGRFEVCEGFDLFVHEMRPGEHGFAGARSDSASVAQR